MINWVIDFLKDRRQRVCVDNLITPFLYINRGVPQGTVVGPVLFTIMVNDISPVSKDTLLIKYADDITCSIPEGPAEQNSLCASNEVDNIKSWAEQNQMSLNLGKTKELMLKTNTSKSPPTAVNGIKQVSTLKLLGVTFHENPRNWDLQFENLMSKAAKRMHILRVCKVNGYSTRDLHYLFTSLIMSIFTYCIRVWAVASHTRYLSQINRLQKRALRFGYIERVIPIEQTIEERDLRMWTDLLNVSKHPLHDLLPSRRKRSLRKRQHNFILPKVKTERFKKCFINRCLFR